DSHLPKGLPVQLKRVGYIVLGTSAVDDFELLAKSRVSHLTEVGPLRQYFANQVRIGMQQYPVAGVDNTGVVDDGPVSDDRLHQIIQVHILCQIVGDGSADWFMIVGIYAGAFQIRLPLSLLKRELFA